MGQAGWNKRKRVRRSRTVRASALSQDERRQLADEAFQVSSQLFAGLEKQRFVENILFRRGRAVLQLYYGDDDTLVGFCSVALREHRVGTKKSFVFTKSVHVALNYDAAARVALFYLRQSIIYRSRHPWNPLYFVAETISPSAFKLIRKFNQLIYPYFGIVPPAHIRALADQLVADCGMRYLDRSHFVARYDLVFKPRAPERFFRSCNLTESDAASYFCRVNPGFERGELMIVTSPITWAGIFYTAKQVLMACLRYRRPSTSEVPMKTTVCGVNAPRQQSASDNVQLGHAGKPATF